MKNMQHVLTSLLADPEFAHLARKFRTRKVLARLELLLPLDMRAALINISYRPPKLLFCFNHPSHCRDFNHYKIADITSCLRAYKEEFRDLWAVRGEADDDLCKRFFAQLEVRAYVPKGILSTLQHSNSSNQVQEAHYIEHAQGVFTNHASDPRLRSLFEDIRTCIIEQGS